MKINQVFETLKDSGGLRAARVITENTKNFSKIKLWYICRQLRHGVPVAKIIHQKWFYGLKFYTNKYTLDPRPDTETLVAAVISDCPENKNYRILDLGTGTGCILAALVKNIHGASGVGADKSWRAVLVARKNMRDLNLARKTEIIKDDFNSGKKIKEQFDIIVSNPPYIATGDTRVNDAAMHDPAMALFAKNNGLAAYQSIAKNAKKWIKNSGKIYLEIGAGQESDVRKIFENETWKFIRSEKDLAGINRVLVFHL